MGDGSSRLLAEDEDEFEFEFEFKFGFEVEFRVDEAASGRRKGVFWVPVPVTC
jgi:hypothetical protein